MFDTKNLYSLSFCGAVKYSSDKDYSCDYSTTPRPCHNLVFMLEGKGTIISGDDIIQIQKGDILYIPQNSVYLSHWNAIPNCVFHSIHFKFAPNHDPFNDKIVPVQLLPCDDFEILYDAVKNIQRYQYSKNLTSFLSLSAFYYLGGKLLPNAKTKEKVSKKNSLTPALLFLEKNYMHNCNVAQLASLCFLSASRFFYLFKKEVGCSPITYKNRVAIRQVAQALLLHKDRSIESIALEYGFKSTIYFTRLFKKIMGKTPSKFRKEERLI